ncbi:MAG: hypothetical protein ABEL04_05385 [Salinibacter sp.]|uniref:hypothetical protein n=1 Tax=Salinibacter sp. TaxID=2065818 RepID=UPI0035D4CC88
MSFPSTDVRPGASSHSTDHIHFYTRFYHLLKGWCYLPTGVLLAVATLTTAVLRPTWLETVWLPLSLLGGSVLLTAPWAYYMHRRYRAAYGHVTQDGGPTSPLGRGSISLPAWMACVLGMLLWMVALVFYIPNTLGYEDNHFVFFFVALPLANGALHAPTLRQQFIYGGSMLILIGVTLIPPALGWPVAVVQALCYTMLGAVVAGAGLYNHRLLVGALGPMDDTGVSVDE